MWQQLMSTPETYPNPAAGFQALLDAHKQDALGVASKLFDDNYQLREKNRELRKQVPAKGAVILSGGDAQAWESFKATGIKAEELQSTIDNVAALEKENKELASMENLREIASLGL